MKFLDHKKGFDFISQSTDPDLFFSRKSVRDGEKIEGGIPVCYEVGRNTRGDVAQNISAIN